MIAVHKDRYTINNGENDVIAELIGKIIYNAASPMDYPAVGDFGWQLIFMMKILFQ